MEKKTKKITNSIVKTTVLRSEIVHDDKDRGTRFHLVYLSGEKIPPIKVIETSDTNLFESWIVQSLATKPKFLSFSMNPRRFSQDISSIHLLHESSAIIYRPSQNPLIPLPQHLVYLIRNLDIEFLGFNMVKKWTKMRFFNQFGVELGPNFKFLTREDNKIDWRRINISSSMVNSSRKASSQWNAGFLIQQNIHDTISELLVCQEAGALRHSGAR